MAQERLIVVGGGDRPAEANERFVDWAGKAQANILVLTWAAPTGSEWDFFEALRDELVILTPGKITHGVIATDVPAQRTTLVPQILQASGIYFTGGNQNYVMDLLDRDAATYPGKDSLIELLRAKYLSGTVFAGTSAGTAVMSSPMLTGQGSLTSFDGSKVGVRAGLGLIANIIFDQHFLAGFRTLRLMGLMTVHPGKLGLGIDEDTALLIQDSRYAEIVGASNVLAMEFNPTSRKVETLPLVAGQKYDLVRRAVY